jgi:hypothetical protein
MEKRSEDIVKALTNNDTDTASNLFNDAYREGQDSLNLVADEVKKATDNWWRTTPIEKDADGNVTGITFDNSFLPYCDSTLFSKSDYSGSVGNRFFGIGRTIPSALDGNN